MKHLLTEWPPLSSRGLCGIVGAAALAALAVTLAGIAVLIGGNASKPASRIAGHRLRAGRRCALGLAPY